MCPADQSESRVEIGRELAHFRIDRRLGQGGMGVVYEATDLKLDRAVAIKVLLPALAREAEFRARFQREMKAAAQVEHPYVVPVYGADYEPPHFYIAMRLVKGGDLASLSRREGPLASERALRVFGQTASALQAVHDEGLVHRDVKPQNILVNLGSSGEETAYLGDFGLAKAIDESTDITRGGPIGTPAYMPPEIVQGRRPGAASDQYSLGCVLFELLSGSPPFVGEDRFAVQQAHLHGPVPDLATHAPWAPARLCDAVTTALAKKPDDRFSDVGQFARAVDTVSREAFEDKEQLVLSIAALPEREKLVFALYHYENLTYAQVGEVLGVTESRVRQIYERAVGRIQTDLGYLPSAISLE